MRKLEIVTVVIGLILIGYSLTLEPLTDMELFEAQYEQFESVRPMTDDFDQPSRESWQLYRDMATPKYRLQDIGIALFLLIGIAGVAWRKGDGQIMSVSNRATLKRLSDGLPVFMVIAYVAYILKGYQRPYGELSLVFEPVGYCFILPVYAYILHLLARIQLNALPDMPLQPHPLALSLKTGSWSLLFVCFFTFFGMYGHAVISLVWVYYYMSIQIYRQAT